MSSSDRRGSYVLGRAATTLLWVGALLAILAPTLSNGFPLVNDDTNIYLRGIRGQWEGTPPFYSMFVLALRAATLFAVPCVQGICTLVTFELALSTLTPGTSAIERAVGSFAVVALTQVPWLASWIMPDVFGGLGIIAVIALLLGRIPVPAWQTLFLMMIVFVSALSSTANTLVLVPIAIICVFARSIWLRWLTDRRLICGMATLAIAAVAVPIAWNTASFGVPRLTVGAGAMLISKLLDAGIAQKYLAENCLRISHPICNHVSDLPRAPHSQNFLWRGSPPLSFRLNAWRDPEGSFSTLAWDIVRHYPGEVLKLALDDALYLSTQLTLGFKNRPGTLELGELRSFRDIGMVRDQMVRLGGHIVYAFDGARQQTGSLEAIYPAPLYRVTVIVSYVGILLMLAIALIRGDQYLGVLATVFLGAALVGIALHGGLVGPYARYHVKVSWLATFAILAGVLHLKTRERELAAAKRPGPRARERGVCRRSRKGFR